MVRIYKDPNQQGSYVNKTKAFLEKAQAGTQVDQKQMINTYMQSIYQKLKNEEEIDDVFGELVASGMSEAIAEKLLTIVVDQMVAAGELNPDNSVSEKQAEEETAQLEKEKAEKESAEQQESEQEEEPDQATDYFNSYGSEDDGAQSDEYQDGGSTEDSQDQPDYSYLEQPDTVVPGLNNYYESAVPLSFYEEPEYKRGGSKKSFVNNVLKKLLEGGEGQDESIGQGNKFDTMDDEVSKRKNNFMNLIKEQANKAKIEDLYNKMIKSNKPELMKIAQTFSDDSPAPEDDTMEQGFQSGGYVGEEQPEMFMYGGTDLPFYEADFLPEARRGIISGKAYNAKTKEEYKDSFEGLNPYAKTVHKRGLFGRPKQWTEYYSKSTGKPIVPTDKDKNLKHGVEKELWDDLSGKAKREIRRGDRQLGREARRGAKSLAEDAKFNKGVHAEYRYDSEEDLARDQKRSDDAWDKDKSFVSDIDKSDNFPYKGNVYLTRDEKGKRFDSPFIVAGPDPGFTEEDYDSKNMIDYEQQQIDEAAAKEASEEKTLLDQIAKEDALAKEEMDLDAERESMIPFEEKENDARTKLQTFYDDEDVEDEEETLSKGKLRLANQFNNLKHFRPDNSKNMELIKAKYDKGLFEEPDREITADEVQSRMQVEDRMDNGFFRYGGLPKAQIGPPEKKESDPTVTTTQLGNIMSKNNGLGDNMSMNPNNLKGMPDQLTTQFLGDPKKEEQPKNDDIIAIDKQRAPSNFTGEDGVNAFNVGATAVTGFMNNLDTAKQEKEMYENNFTSDNMYAASNSKDRGDYVDYGQQLGQFRYDQMGSDTSGRFAYGQEGGYMQDGGQNSTYENSQEHLERLNNYKKKENDGRTIEHRFTNPPTYIVRDTNGKVIHTTTNEEVAKRYLKNGSSAKSYNYGGYMQEGGYAEDDEVEMTEEELEEFLANGGEVEYI